MPDPNRPPKTVRFRLPKGVVEHFRRSKTSSDGRHTAHANGLSRLSRAFESLSVSGALVMIIACGCLATAFVLEFTVRR